jgi:mono/diheme cytochrome c family protein
VPASAQSSAAPAAFAEKGRETYNVYCVRCHGANMKSPGTPAYDLRVFPAEQHDRFVQSVRKGKNSMPPWESILKEDDIENLWACVMSAKAKSN